MPDFIGRDPESNSVECPAVFVSPETGDFHFRGKTVTDPAVIAAMNEHVGKAEDESDVWLPARIDSLVRPLCLRSRVPTRTMPRQVLDPGGASTCSCGAPRSVSQLTDLRLKVLPILGMLPIITLANMSVTVTRRPRGSVLNTTRPKMSADTLRTHPTVIVDGMIHENPFYIESAAFLSRLG